MTLMSIQHKDILSYSYPSGEGTFLASSSGEGNLLEAGMGLIIQLLLDIISYLLHLEISYFVAILHNPYTMR